MRVLLATSFGKGGPPAWAEQMREHLSPEAEIELIRQPSQLPRLVLARPDIVHTTIPFVRSRRPLIATIKGDFRQESPLYRQGYESLLRRARFITVPSKYLRQKLNRTDVEVIPNAVPSRPRSWAAEGHRYILIASNLDLRQKAQGVADAVSALTTLGAKTRLEVAGGGRFEHLVDAVIRRAPSTFRRIGWRTDIGQRLQRADLVVHWSYLDNQPNLVIEAMMTGVPVLANRVGDLPNMLPPEALVDDLNGLPGRAETILQGQGVDRLSRVLHARALAKFSWQQVKPQWLSLYARCEVEPRGT